MPTKKRKNYTEEAMNHYFDGSYYAHPSNISTPDSITNDIFTGMMSNRRTLPLTEHQVNNNGINAAFVIGEGRNTPTVPTYSGGALIPEITVTPKGTRFDDPINRVRYVRTLERRGGLIRFR